MSDVLYLAWRYLAHHRIKTAILLFSVTLILYLPNGLNVLIDQSASQLTARAASTPLLVGAKGSPLELVLNSLYFESDPPETTTWEQLQRVRDTGFASTIPLYVRFKARNFPIVGTDLGYFDARGLELAHGRMMAVPGECVLGWDVAEELNLGPGDHLISSPESVFDLAGVYPLKMHVIGVLARAHSPDDRGIFVDVKTTWIIQGLGHGHQDLSRPEAASGVLSRSENTIVANASVVQYNEITTGNMASFHFHGDLSAFPLTAIIAIPADDKSRALLMGRFENPEETQQIVRPTAVMDELLETILTIQSYVVAAVLMVGAGTLATAALVFMLSLRLRQREIETMTRIGGSRATIIAVLAAEIASVIAASAAVAALLTFLTGQFGSAVIRNFILT